MMKKISWKLVRFNLSKEGYRVECTTTGEAAIESIKRAQPDLMVLDLMLPGMDGFQVARYLKENPETPPYPHCDVDGQNRRGQMC